MNYLHESRQGAVAVLTISRPKALNALNTPLLNELKECFDALSKNKEVRAVVLTGEGKAFVAGADIAEMKDFTPQEALAYAQRGSVVFEAIESLPQPAIAAINGYALGGGCELALACDIRLASQKARFGQPETGLGITPGFGGTQRLPRVIGQSAAMRMILTAETVDAEEALRLGLVDATYAPDVLLKEAIALATRIAQNAPLAVQAAKAAIRQSADLSLAKGLESEAALFAQCFQTLDQKRAMAAFVEKRKPEAFEGR